MGVFGFDAYSPAEIARRVNDAGVARARLPIAATAMLGVLAGAFIAIGSLYYTLVAADATLGFAATRVLGGLVFSVGLVLVVVAGGELFTGNNLLAMAWADGGEDRGRQGHAAVLAGVFLGGVVQRARLHGGVAHACRPYRDR